MDELNDRQAALVAQVRVGRVEEDLPDTEDQLLALARLGHLEAEHGADGWTFTVPAEPEPEGEPAPEPTEG